MKNIRGVILSEDEVVIREYEASYISVPKSEGYVIATNRRLIFTGSTKSATGSGVIVRETKIDNISGINAGLAYQRSFLQLIIGIIVTIVSFFMIADDFGLLGWLVLLVGAALIFWGLKAGGTIMYISILASQSSAAINVAVEANRGLWSRVQGNQAIMTVAASGPGMHTEQLIYEIGALIQDIQVMGDLSINKWKNRPLERAEVMPLTRKEQIESTIDTVKTTASKLKESATVATSTVSEIVTQVKESKVNPQDVTGPDSSIQSSATETRCEKCGTIIAKEDMFCGECGTKQETNIFG